VRDYRHFGNQSLASFAVSFASFAVKSFLTPKVAKKSAKTAKEISI
jgi:hypothetical protein